MPLKLRWQPGERTVTWLTEGQLIVKDHDSPIRSAAAVREPPSVVIVEQPGSGDPGQNAVVYEPDGTERLRLKVPPTIDAIGFDQVFQSRAGLIAVFATRHGDFQGDPDLCTGELHNIREWR